MPKSPKNREEKIERMVNAWRTLAPEKTFGGMTLAQFEATAAGPSRSVRQRIDDLNDQLTQALAERDEADEVFDKKARQVVNGVLADPSEGPDSALYEAFGYTRLSDHKSGLTHKGTRQTPGK